MPAFRTSGAALLLVLALPGARADSLYAAQTYRPLVADRRAHQPGDSVTILVYENSSATTAADTALRRKTELGLQAGLHTPGRHVSDEASLAANSDFSGGGTIQRSGKLLAQLTVNVSGVAPNGDLLVSGEQLIEVNNDRQQIRVEGRVRPLDISDANTVLSSRLADARISYAGSGGELAARQKPGFLSKLLVWMGL
jgi:flagellar L-ring protein precursor FlgH